MSIMKIEEFLDREKKYRFNSIRIVIHEHEVCADNIPGTIPLFIRSDEYEKLVSRVTKTTLSSGKILGGPYAWKKRNGFKFLQGPSAEELLSRGVKNLLLEESDGFAKTEGSRS